MSENPCVSCGACCAHFRVSFYWGEADEAPGGIVPSALTERVNSHMSCMKGTQDRPPRCVALSGEVGNQVVCTIYEFRPSPCREFDMYEPDGTVNPRCEKLRASLGLPWPSRAPAVEITHVMITPIGIPATDITPLVIPPIEIPGQLITSLAPTCPGSEIAIG